MRAKMTRLLLAIVGAATDEETKAGATWYDEGNQACRDLAKRYQCSLATAAGVVAALSPRVTWKQNMRLAHAVLGNTYEKGALKANLAKALAIANGARPLMVLGGDKVRAFYRALTGDTKAIVVDVWMLRAVRYTRGITRKAYRVISSAIEAAALALALAPARLQAIVWVAVRGKAA